MTARGLGMGGAYTALARGVHAPMWNPANLGLPDNPKFSMTFISVGAGVWNNSFTKEMYDKYLVNGTKDEDGNIIWTQQDIEDILNHIPDGGFGLDVGASFGTFSFSTGRFAMTIGAKAGTYLKLDKTFFEIPLEGTDINEEYNFDNSDGRALGVGVVGLSWGQPLNVSFADAFAVGGTVNILYGGAYGQPDKTELTVATETYGIDIDGEYRVTYAYLGGVGWGLDLGTAAQIGKKWTVSFGLANVLGSIPFSNNIEIQEGYFRGDSLSVVSDFEEDFVDSTWTIDGESFTTKLPTILRLGCSYREGSVLLTADYRQGFHNTAFASSTPRFALGTEWKGLKWLPLRMGVVMGGRIGFGTSFGLGIRPGGFVFDIGVMNRGFVVPKNSKGLIVAVEIGMELHRKKSEVVEVGDF